MSSAVERVQPTNQAWTRFFDPYYLGNVGLLAGWVIIRCVPSPAARGAGTEGARVNRDTIPLNCGKSASSRGYISS